MSANTKNRQLNWEDLKIFLTVYRSGNIAGAAKKLRLDDSTISRRIAQLEACLGSKLFERNRNGMRQTAFANTLIHQLERVEIGILGLNEIVLQEKNIGGTVRIAMMEGIGSLYLAHKFSPFLNDHPAIKIELVTSPNYIRVGYREADLFLSFFKLSGKGITCEKIGEFSLYLYASPGYLKRNGRPNSKADLIAHEFVTYIDDLVQIDTVRWLDEVIQNPTISVSSSSMVAQIALTSSGAGISLLPKFSITKESNLVPILKDEIQVKREVYISSQSDLLNLERILTVKDYLEQIFINDHQFLNKP
jgi:DNA-binding transcriptional LysR family regulator